MESVTLESSRRHTFHLIGLAHLPQSTLVAGCAFSSKNIKLAKMLTGLGHAVVFYGSAGSDVEEYCDSDNLHFVETHTMDDIRDDYGDGDNRFLWGYNHVKTGWRHDFNATPKPSTIKFNRSVIEHMAENAKPDDFLLITQGTYQKSIADAAGLFLTCEPGIGYRGSFTRFRAFESTYLQNFTYGSEHPRKCINGDYYSRVIPNYFDKADFPFVPKEERGDYYFYIGRMIERKGVHTAIKAVEALGAKLILAGQGDMKIDSPNCEYVGYVEPEERSRLLGHAIATFVPTLYLEAFGGVHVESMLTGTPPICTNFGVFPGTITHGANGYLCNTLNDFVVAAKDAQAINRNDVRTSGERYTMDNVRWEFQRWFDDIYALWESAQDPSVKGWHRLKD
jgi:glycosyltransferase involved in cell wall biosynthesis